MEQQDLGLGREYAHRSSAQLELADFKGLPERVFPTTARVLECNGHLLIVKHYEQKHSEIPAAHLKVWRALIALAADPDAGGSVSVLALWGRNGTSVRFKQLLDWVVEGKREQTTDDVIISSISGWYSQMSRRRV